MWKLSLIFVAVTCVSIQLAYAKITEKQDDSTSPTMPPRPVDNSPPPSTTGIVPNKEDSTAAAMGSTTGAQVVGGNGATTGSAQSNPGGNGASTASNAGGNGESTGSTASNAGGDGAPTGQTPSSADSSSLTEEKADTGCNELDTCVKSLQDVLNGKFTYNNAICLAIREALSCFKTAIDGCDDYKDPFAGKTESFLTLRDHLQNYCSDAGAAASSCADFTTCFTEVNLPQAANDLVDPMYWCAVGQAAASCSAKLTSESDECKTVKKYGEIKTELDKTCPSPVDVLNGVFGAKDSGVDAGRYNIMVIMVASLVTIKMVY